MHEFLCLEKPSREVYNLNSGALLRSVSNFKKHFFRGTVAIKAELRKNAKALLKQEQALKKELDDLVIEENNVKRKLTEAEVHEVIVSLNEAADGILLEKIKGFSFKFAKKVSISLDEAPKMTKQFEALHRTSIYENGHIYKPGAKTADIHTSNLPDKILWPPHFWSKFINAICTHNHPKGTGLSTGDLVGFAKRNMKELRAITPQGEVFSISWKKNISARQLRGVNDEIKIIIKEYKKRSFKTIDEEAAIIKQEFEAVFKVLADNVNYIHYTK